MKAFRRKLPLFFLSLSLAALLMSCMKDDAFDENIGRNHKRSCYQTVIKSLDVPNEIQAGKATVLGVNYMKPTPCYSLDGFQLIGQRTLLKLNVCLKVPVQPCVDVIDWGYDTFSVTIHKPGIYQIYYNGVAGEEIQEIQVK